MEAGGCILLGQERKKDISDKEARRKKQWQYRGKYINSQRLNKETWDGWGKKIKRQHMK